MGRDSDNVKWKLWPRVLGVLVLLVCLTLFVSGLLLKRGIELDHFTSGPVTVSDFLLQWQEKLELQIGTITVEEQGGSGFSKNFNLIDKGIRAAGFLSNFFSDFSVKTIRIRDFNGSVYLHEGEEPSFFNIESDDLIVRSTLVLKKNSLVVHIDQLSSKRFKSEAEGEIHLGGGKNHVSGTLRANLAGVLPVLLDFTANGEQVSFSGKEAGVIRDITPFVDLFGLDNNIQRWITGYLKGSRYRLKTFAGSIPWNDPAAGLNRLYAEGRVDDLEYTFAPGSTDLEPVKAAYGDVIFSRGVLTIVPFDSTFHGREIRGGSVEIDFTRPADIILTTYIKARTRADGDILS
ncbi:MAG: hypothetical protein JRJ68_12705, partial [Deltaproteobacteria bacterium]|nr:hypothetical protein [Deltaproteobacteria bacterium]